jgi:steroid delta-isomerase-like uncharacterized protein
MSEENKALVVEATEKIWNQNDVSAIERFISPNFTGHDPAVPGVIVGLDGYTHYFKTFATAFPDQHFTDVDVLSELDRVIVRWFVEGTHTGNLGDLPPTGKKVHVKGINIVHVANGLIFEEYMSWDTLGLIKQLGPSRPRS